MKKCALVFLAAVLLLSGCASTGKGKAISLQEAIDRSAKEIAEELPKGSRIAIVAFKAEHENLSDYIIDELSSRLFAQGFEIAERQNLAYIYKELQFQLSGDVSDETIESVGNFIGAQLVLTGSLTDLGKSYRYRAVVFHVKEATRASDKGYDVHGGTEMRRMVTTLALRQNVVAAPKYGVTEQTTPQTAGTFLDRGILLASQGKNESAAADFTEVIALNPEMFAAYLLRGKISTASASRVVSVDGGLGVFDSIANYNTVTPEQKRIFEQTLADFDIAIKIEPDNVKIYNERGVVYLSAGDFDKAIAVCSQAIQINPNSAAAYNNRGFAYYGKKDYNKAVEDCTQTIQLQPNSAATFSNRGFAYYGKKDLDNALADYNQALALDPTYARAYNGRAIIHYQRRNYDQALADYNQAILYDPKLAPAYNGRGVVHYQRKDYDRAIADYSQAIELDPTLAAAYNNRGTAYYYKGDYDRVIADCTQAIRLDPNYAIAYFSRGSAYYNKRDYDRAITDYESTLRLNPNHANAKKNLEIVRQARSR